MSSVTRAVDGPNMLANASLNLLYEMVRRLPSAKDPHMLVTWQRDARRLGNVLARLDLWPLLLSKPYRQRLVTLAEQLLNLRHGLVVLDATKKELPPDVRAAFVLFILFIDGPALDDRHETDRFIRNYYWRDLRSPGFWLASLNGGPVDPISDLWHIPLPKELENLVGSGLKDRASLYHALTAFIGSPTAPGGNTPLIDLVLFASACIVGPDGGRPLSLYLSGWDQWHGEHNVSDGRRAAVQALADNAWSWLKEHLPSIVFPKALEGAIESSANLRYPAAK
jgi:hypothetical protein